MRRKGLEIHFISVGAQVLGSTNGIDGMGVKFVEGHVAHGLSNLCQEAMVEVCQIEIGRHPIFHPRIGKEHVGKAKHKLQEVLSIDRAHDSHHDVWKVQ